MSLPNRTKVITILSNEYTVTFPNTQQQMNIDLLKVKLTDGQYDALKYSMNALLVRQATVVETIATFNVLIPKLKEHLNTDSLLKLEYDQMDIVVKAYEEQFLPFYEEWMVIFQAKGQEEKKEDSAK